MAMRWIIVRTSDLDLNSILRLWVIDRVHVSSYSRKSGPFLSVCCALLSLSLSLQMGKGTYQIHMSSTNGEYKD